MKIERRFWKEIRSKLRLKNPEVQYAGVTRYFFEVDAWIVTIPLILIMKVNI